MCLINFQVVESLESPHVLVSPDDKIRFFIKFRCYEEDFSVYIYPYSVSLLMLIYMFSQSIVENESSLVLYIFINNMRNHQNHSNHTRYGKNSSRATSFIHQLIPQRQRPGSSSDQQMAHPLSATLILTIPSETFETSLTRLDQIPPETTIYFLDIMKN